MKRKAVFLDRDGTICEEVGYLDNPSRLQLLPGSAEAIRALNESGWLVVVITNQSGVARGFFTEETLHEINQTLKDELAAVGARIDATYYCPHHPTEGEGPYRLDCDCRKPKPGMIVRAVADLEIDLNQCWMVGDRYGDVALAHTAGVRSALVLTGYGREEWESQSRTWEHQPDLLAENLMQAVEAIKKGCRGE